MHFKEEEEIVLCHLVIIKNILNVLNYLFVHGLMKIVKDLAEIVKI